MNAEQIRLEEARTGKARWKKWGPYPRNPVVTVTIGGGLDVCKTEHRNERDADMICAADLAESRSRTTQQAPRKCRLPQTIGLVE
jgi:hypothetical protein